jgi:L,D-peptidoglycan transpeptidase YkuD (ErfK/YbiS/YcfS/YnhG family)
MTRRLWCRALAATLLLGACGAKPSKVETASVSTITSPTTSTSAASSATTSTTRRRTARPTSASKPKAVALPAQLDQVKGNQAIIVTTEKYGATAATVSAYTRGANGWAPTFGPWSGYVGAKGIAPPGEKREGDGRTPTGTFGFDFMFGVKPDPGVRYEFRRVTGPNIVWVEDSTSPFYNQWVDANEHPEEADEDNMYKPGVYDYGAVINYNTKERTPGMGSGIFLHISRNRPTAGCVSLSVEQVVKILKWLDPAASPAIVIGVR